MMFGITEVFTERFLMISPREKAWRGAKKKLVVSQERRQMYLHYTGKGRCRIYIWLDMQ